eukprot:jgi/Tetstr1/466828/TSEL_001024.t1
MGLSSLFSRLGGAAPLGKPPRQPAPPPRAEPLPEDTLPAESLVPQFLSHFGVPENADKLAYDCHQRLLAVGCTDGRVKVYGQDGAEVLYRSPSHTPTRALLFVPHRLAVMRIAEDGLVEVFSLVAPYQRTAVLHTLTADPPHCAAVLPAEDNHDWLLLGCASGAMRVARATAGPYGTRACSLQIRSLQMMPYAVGADEWGFDKVVGPLISLEPQPRTHSDCLLAVHSDGLVVWSLSHAGASASAHRNTGGGDLFQDVGDLHSACWAAPDGSTVASAHSNGDVLIWQLPPCALPDAAPPPGALPDTGEVLHALVRLRVTPDTFTSAINSVRLVREGLLLVQGGQSMEQPEGLSLLRLPSKVAGEGEGAAAEEWGAAVPEDVSDSQAQSLPWFGAINGFQLLPKSPAPAGGSAETAAALVLSEHGQLIMYALEEHVEACQFPLSNQAAGPVTALEWLRHQPVAHVSSIESATPRSKGALAVTVDDLSPLPRLLRPGDPADGDQVLPSPGRGTADWSWVVSGGRGAEPPQGGAGVADMLATGHASGRCLLWDTRTQVPMCRGVVMPAGADEEPQRVAPVSCVALCWEAGLLAVGHADGKLRLYQWRSRRRQVAPLTVDLHGMRPGSNSRPQAPGFHLVMEANVHSAAVSAIAVGTGYHLMAFGDENGKVSVFDLGRGAFLFMIPVAQGPGVLVDMHFGTLPHGSAVASPKSPPPRVLSPGSAGALQDVVLYCLGEDFGVSVVDCATGRVIGHSGSGQRGLKGVSMQPLSDSGAPQPPPTRPPALGVGKRWRRRWAEVKLSHKYSKPVGAPHPPDGSSHEEDGPVAANASMKEDKGQEEPASQQPLCCRCSAGEALPEEIALGAAANERGGGGGGGRRRGGGGGGGAVERASESDSDLLEAAAAAADAQRDTASKRIGGQRRSVVDDFGHKTRGLLKKAASSNRSKGGRTWTSGGPASTSSRGSSGGSHNGGDEAGLRHSGEQAVQPAASGGGVVRRAERDVGSLCRTASASGALQPTASAPMPDISAPAGAGKEPNSARYGRRRQRPQRAAPAQAALRGVDNPPEAAAARQQPRPAALDVGQPDGSSLHREPSVAVFEVNVKELWTSFLLLASDQRIEVCRPHAGRQRARRRSRALSPLGARPLAVLTTSNQLLVYGLPRLTSLLAVHMEYCLGWPVLPPHARSLRAAMGPQGQMAVSMKHGEMVRLALADSVALAAPKTMCDIARAEDLHKRAAQAAREAVLRRQRAWAAAGEASEGEAAAGEAGSQSGSEASHSARGPKLPGNVAGFLGGLEKFGGDLLKNLRIPEHHLRAGGCSSGTLDEAHLRPMMDLESLFAQSAEEAEDPADMEQTDSSRLDAEQSLEIDSDLDLVPDLDDSGSSAVPEGSGRGTRAAASRPVDTVIQLDTSKGASSGARIISSAPPPPPASSSAAPKVRSSEEIKKLYGRKTGAAASVMADNVQRMEERGERLGRLQDKTAAMENDARNFAEMATKLAEQSGAGKKWWQL